MVNPKDEEAIAGKFRSTSSHKEDFSPPTGRSSLPSDSPDPSQPQTLAEFREEEGRANRKRRLQALWKSLPDVLLGPHNGLQVYMDTCQLTPEKAKSLQKMYDRELVDLCATYPSTGEALHIGWRKFKEFAEKKEVGMSFLEVGSFPLIIDC